MANKIVREIIHAKGIDIGIYTKDFENEYISLTDIAKYRNDNDPRFVIQNHYNMCINYIKFNISNQITILDTIVTTII